MSLTEALACIVIFSLAVVAVSAMLLNSSAQVSKQLSFFIVTT